MADDAILEQAPPSGLAAALDRSVAGWAAGVARRPLATLALLALLVAGAVWAATGLRVDTDSSRMLASHLDYQIRARALEAAFPGLKESLVVVVRAETADDADRAARLVAERLRLRPALLAEVFSPAADPVLQAHGLLFLDADKLEAKLDRLRRLAPLIGALRAEPSLGTFFGLLRQAAQHPEAAGDLGPVHAETERVVEAVLSGQPRRFAWSWILGGEPGQGPVLRTVTVQPALDYGRLSPAHPAIEAVRAELEVLRDALGPAVALGLTGDPVLRAEELESVTRTLPLSLGLSLLLVAVLLRLFLGSIGRSLLALAALVVTLVLTTGFAALAVGALNLISVAFVVLMVGLGIDFAIHFIAHLAEPGPRAAAARLEAAGRTVGAALWLSAASTALAFMAFTLTDFVGMAQLGLIGGVGVLVAFAVSVTLIPAVVALRPALVAPAPLRPPTIRTWPGRLAALVAAGIGVAAMVVGSEVRFDSDPMSLRDPSSPSVVAHSWLAADPATAPERFSLLARSASEAEALAGRAKAVEGVADAVWLGDLVPEDQAEKLALIDAARPVLRPALAGEGVALPPATALDLATALAGGDPDARRLAGALSRYAAARGSDLDMALERALLGGFPEVLDRLSQQLEAGVLTEQELPLQLTRRFRSPEGHWRVEVRPAIDMTDPAARRALNERLRAALPGLTGPPTQIEGARRTVAAAMLQATAIAFLTTGLITWLVLGRLVAVGAILLPLALAGAVVAAASVLLDMPFNFANVIVLPLMIGIGVDSGIHMASRAARAGRHSVFATSTPRAVLASALTTIAAFGTLGLSAHPGTASMGWMLAIALAASIAMIFALTPVLSRPARR